LIYVVIGLTIVAVIAVVFVFVFVFVLVLVFVYVLVLVLVFVFVPLYVLVIVVIVIIIVIIVVIIVIVFVFIFVIFFFVVQILVRPLRVDSGHGPGPGLPLQLLVQARLGPLQLPPAILVPGDPPVVRRVVLVQEVGHVARLDEVLPVLAVDGVQVRDPERLRGPERQGAMNSKASQSAARRQVSGSSSSCRPSGKKRARPRPTPSAASSLCR